MPPESTVWEVLLDLFAPGEFITSAPPPPPPPQSSPWVINNYSTQPWLFFFFSLLLPWCLHAVPSLRHRGTPTASIIKHSASVWASLCVCFGTLCCVFWAQSEPRCVWMRTSERDGPLSVMSGEVNSAELSFIHKANRDCAVNGNKCVMIYLQLFVFGPRRLISL